MKDKIFVWHKPYSSGIVIASSAKEAKRKLKNSYCENVDVIEISPLDGYEWGTNDVYYIPVYSS